MHAQTLRRREALLRGVDEAPLILLDVVRSFAGTSTKREASTGETKGIVSFKKVNLTILPLDFSTDQDFFEVGRRAGGRSAPECSQRGALAADGGGT
eukprot:362474-Chlamydomonas_euryale.AAC.2